MPIEHQPTTAIEARAIPRGGVRCQATPFSKQQIQKAVQKGAQLHKQGKQVGKNKYPHRFNNREGFDFDVEGPYLEFPILKSDEVFDGSSMFVDSLKPQSAIMFGFSWPFPITSLVFVSSHSVSPLICIRGC